MIEKSSLGSFGLCLHTTDLASNEQATLLNNDSITIEQLRVKVREEIKRDMIKNSTMVKLKLGTA